jgi:hypothetical protein
MVWGLVKPRKFNFTFTLQLWRKAKVRLGFCVPLRWHDGQFASDAVFQKTLICVYFPSTWMYSHNLCDLLRTQLDLQPLPFFTACSPPPGPCALPLFTFGSSNSYYDTTPYVRMDTSKREEHLPEEKVWKITRERFNSHADVPLTIVISSGELPCYIFTPVSLN